MKAWRVTLALVALVTPPASGISQVAQTGRVQQPNVDWFQVLESLAIPSPIDVPHPTWMSAAALPWITWAGDEQTTPSGKERRGKVIVTVNGKPLLVSGQEHPWDLQAFGVADGVGQVWVSSAVLSADLKLDVDRDLTQRDVDWAAVKCGTNAPSKGVKFYQVEPTGKKTFWLLHSWTCERAECSAELRAFYQQPRPQDLVAATSPCSA